MYLVGIVRGWTSFYRLIRMSNVFQRLRWVRAIVV
ncbi:group II intron maturase-specific domain-containing protein [Photobacterium damselae]